MKSPREARPHCQEGCVPTCQQPLTVGIHVTSATTTLQCYHAEALSSNKYWDKTLSDQDTLPLWYPLFGSAGFGSVRFGPVSRHTTDTVGSEEEVLLLYDPGTISMIGDDARTTPPHTQVTAVPESVMSWLSMNIICLARCEGPAKDFAVFTAAGTPCLYVGDNPGPPSALAGPPESSDS